MHAIFRPEGKIIPWHSPLVAILTNLKLGFNFNCTQEDHDYPKNMKERLVETSIISMNRQIVLTLRAQRHLTVATNESVLKII